MPHFCIKPECQFLMCAAVYKCWLAGCVCVVFVPFCLSLICGDLCRCVWQGVFFGFAEQAFRVCRRACSAFPRRLFGGPERCLLCRAGGCKVSAGSFFCVPGRSFSVCSIFVLMAVVSDCVVLPFYFVIFFCQDILLPADLCLCGMR